MKQKPDYEALFRVSPYPYLVMGAEANLPIIAANKAYLAIVDRNEADIVGRPFFEAFPKNPDDPDSTRTREVRTSIETAIETAKPNSTPFLRYAIPVDKKGGIEFEERYWSIIHTPSLDKAGRVTSVVQNPIDVTQLYHYDKSLQVASFRPTAGDTAEQLNRAQMHAAMVRMLNDERGHLRNLFNQAPGFVAVMTGPNHVFELANEAYYQLIGHRDIIGKPVWEALPEVADQGYAQHLDHVFNTGEPWATRGMKLLVQREPNGPLIERYIDLVYQPYLADNGNIIGIFAQGYDVTDFVHAQAARRESEDRLREGMRAAKMVVWDWDVASRRIVFSDNVLEVLGRKPETIDDLLEFVEERDRRRMRKLHNRAVADKTGYHETIRVMREDNGRSIWIDVRGKVLCDDEGKPYAVRGVTVDVTDRVQAERELIRADRRKNEFLAMLAHELRNPLAPISSAAELIKLVKLDEKRLQQTSDIILRQIGHMTGLVDDLIDVSRVTRGLITTDRKPLDIKQIITDAVEQTGPALAAKHHELQVELPDEDAMVLGDMKRLVQVLSNLLNNAAKYTPDGGRISLKMELDSEQVRIRVQDNGIGINPDLLPRVFDLFTQAERTSDRSQGGLGVGLALVKSLIELHGGEVSARSAGNGNGKGSTFLISLPRLHQTPKEEDSGDDSSPLKGSVKALQVMIVDDNADAASMLGLFLEASGHRVITADSARMALERVRRQVPDVFLLDIGLPEMDGIQLARRLRSYPPTADSIMIAITGYGQEQDRLNTDAAGFDHHLVKPVDTKKLLKLLADISRTLYG